MAQKPQHPRVHATRLPRPPDGCTLVFELSFATTAPVKASAGAATQSSPHIALHIR